MIFAGAATAAMLRRKRQLVEADATRRRVQERHPPLSHAVTHRRRTRVSSVRKPRHRTTIAQRIARRMRRVVR